MTSKLPEVKRLYKGSHSYREIAEIVRLPETTMYQKAKQPKLDTVIKIQKSRLKQICQILKNAKIEFETVDGEFELTEYYESKL